MTTNAIIDRDAALNLIDELRVAVPEEVRAGEADQPARGSGSSRSPGGGGAHRGPRPEQAAFLIEERGLTEAAVDEAGASSPSPRTRRSRSGAGQTTTPPACSPGPRPTRPGRCAASSEGSRCSMTAGAADMRAETGTTATMTRRGHARRGRGRGGGLGRRTAMTSSGPDSHTPSTRSATRSPSPYRASWPRCPAPSATTRSTMSRSIPATAWCSRSRCPAGCGCCARTAASSSMRG